MSEQANNVMSTTAKETLPKVSGNMSMFCLCLSVVICIYLLVELARVKRTITTMQSAQINNDDISYLANNLPEIIMNKVNSNVSASLEIQNKEIIKSVEEMLLSQQKRRVDDDSHQPSLAKEDETETTDNQDE